MDIRYLAGLVDADGCIQFTRCRGNFIPRIMVINTSLPLLEAIKEEYGGWISTQSFKKIGWKPAYTWALTNCAAVALAERLEPFLILKKEHCLLFYGWDAIRPGRGHNKRWAADGMLEAVQLLVDQIKWLNWRGLGRPLVDPVSQCMGGA